LRFDKTAMSFVDCNGGAPGTGRSSLPYFSEVFTAA
jgi:hypothetical protein